MLLFCREPSEETVPKLSISLVGHGFSRAKTLVSKRFANLKVCPTQKIMNFGTASAVSYLLDCFALGGHDAKLAMTNFLVVLGLAASREL